MAEKEICTMIKLFNFFEVNQAKNQETYEPIPRVANYGVVKLLNFGAIDQVVHNLTYYIMPLYEMNL